MGSGGTPSQEGQATGSPGFLDPRKAAYVARAGLSGDTFWHPIGSAGSLRCSFLTASTIATLALPAASPEGVRLSFSSPAKMVREGR
jgi:hypothetical protein